MQILPFFVHNRVKEFVLLAAPIRGTSRTAEITDYPSTPKDLIGSFLNEDNIEDHCRAVRTATAMPWEDEELFGRRLSSTDEVLGRLLTEVELRAILSAGVTEYVRLGVRSSELRKLRFNHITYSCEQLRDSSCEITQGAELSIITKFTRGVSQVNAAEDYGIEEKYA